MTYLSQHPVGHRPDRVLIIGAGGLVGQALCAELANRHIPVRALVRSALRARGLTVLPRLELVQGSAFDRAAVANAMQGCTAMVNLIGLLHGDQGEPYGRQWQVHHVDLPRYLAGVCARQKFKFIHVSALGADSEGPSMYQRSKGDGEYAVMNTPDLRWGIVRPSVIVGAGGGLLPRLVALQRLTPLLPLPIAHAKFAPVVVTDVAEAISAVVSEDVYLRRIYELAGPHVLTMREIAEQIAEAAGLRCRMFAVPERIARLQAFVFEHLPGIPPLSRDNLDSMAVDNVPSGKRPTLVCLDIAPTAIRSYLTQIYRLNRGSSR